MPYPSRGFGLAPEDAVHALGRPVERRRCDVRVHVVVLMVEYPRMRDTMISSSPASRWSVAARVTQIVEPMARAARPPQRSLEGSRDRRGVQWLAEPRGEYEVAVSPSPSCRDGSLQLSSPMQPEGRGHVEPLRQKLH